MQLSLFTLTISQHKNKNSRMGNKSAIFLLLLVTCHVVSTFGWFYDAEEEMKETGESGHNQHEFILQRSKQVVKTEAGHMSIMQGGHLKGRLSDKPLHVAFITMEPNSLFIPQYLDSDQILFIRRGEARVGLIYKDDLVEQRLKKGDVYRIPAGSPFYIVNNGQERKLHIISSIDRSDSMTWGSIQSFFIGGGSYPTSILAGFDNQTLVAAFNVPISELSEILNRQQQGPIVFLNKSPELSIWTKFVEMEHHHREEHLTTMLQYRQNEVEEDEEEKEKELLWSFRKLLRSVFGSEDKQKRVGKSSPHAYNLYDRKPDFKNNYGWSLALDHRDYKPLRRSDIGVYLVKLSQGSMMAPHINPTATEFGIVLSGSGRIQVVHPNGTLAMDAKVREGDVFWIPRYFPFCQVASGSGSFEFFGFTTSASKNRPQFLIGKNSVLKTMKGPEFAAGFGVSEKRLKKVLNAQSESTILPWGSNEVAPAEREETVSEKLAEVLASYGDGF